MLLSGSNYSPGDGRFVCEDGVGGVGAGSLVEVVGAVGAGGVWSLRFSFFYVV